MADTKQGNPTKSTTPPNMGSPAKPAVAPSTKPNTPSGPTVDTSGTPNFLAAETATFADVYNDSSEGFVGVDPIYQNYASHVDAPKPTEPEEEPETP
ncbi:hypothetical protein SEA_GIBBLES_15 [Gordonia phage Gibbles]|uniref:Uncharacterized protein n=3 Tax=Gordonia phage Orchid TaxID=1838075 RepID=A0A166YG74_9CAUD|nr:hypothetical protein BH761_gp016 [Gordonia phage Orchid]ANA87250.1 hypothetical protein PBI_PATRICKSTAR_16 [Gordonia phage PatrickStar]ANA87363.1 hypothetical protein PBI_ORCHID_16 [Gordonia phage Orchid]ANA87477.1 hypothetical protein PBI_KAMPE_16 [Gordonia phage Kampe]QDK01974.1 hypothetical protein SEA_GIBBLES_15 [Gordonia phage Gibbles]